MNFLAHLYLAAPNPASMIGNLLPDMVPGPLAADLQPDVLAAARNHKRVDAFTDTHPVFTRSRARFRDRHGRFSAILTDLFYDHILARDWDLYHGQPLDSFINEAHANMTGHDDLMPPPMRPIIARMIDQGWLRQYATLPGMAVILEMMSRRFSERLHRPIDLVEAVNDMAEIDAALTDDFAEFFPQLVMYVRGDENRRLKVTPIEENNTTHNNASAESGSEPILQ